MNTRQKQFQEEVRETATSIQKEFGIEIDRNEVIKEFCNQMENKLRKRMGEF